jgi:hypothetical protein
MTISLNFRFVFALTSGTWNLAMEESAFCNAMVGKPEI